jgi:metallopeptidase MepB
MAGLEPPQASPKWTHSAQEITTLAKAAIAGAKTAMDQVGSLADKDCNFQSVSNTRFLGIIVPAYGANMLGLCE